jgi:hypothetical protein
MRDSAHELPRGEEEDDDEFDVSAAVHAHPFIALGIALGAGVLYALATRIGRVRRASDTFAAIAIAAVAGTAANALRGFALRSAVALWRAPYARGA